MIRSYTFGSINIDGKVYRTDVLVFPDRINSQWWRQAGHLLNERDLKEVFDFKPEILVIGTGASGLMKVEESLKQTLEDKNIEFIIKRTPEAVDAFNLLRVSKRTAAAFHITC